MHPRKNYLQDYFLQIIQNLKDPRIQPNHQDFFLATKNPEKIKSCKTRRYFIVDPYPNPISI